MIFETPRLIIRLLRKEDILPFHEMQTDPEVMKYTGTPAKSRKENEEDLDYVISCYSIAHNDFWVWAVERKTDHAFIGTCAIVKTEVGQFGKQEDELGLRLLRKHWGNGYGKELIPAMLDYAFRKMNITEIIAEVDQRNMGSVKILEPFMTFEKAYFNEKDKTNDNLYRVRRKDDAC
jgi:[ribosomal protein S5]-alanine N-acetyltransferase